MPFRSLCPSVFFLSCFLQPTRYQAHGQATQNQPLKPKPVQEPEANAQRQKITPGKTPKATFT